MDGIRIFRLSIQVSIQVSTRMSPLPFSDWKAWTILTGSLQPCLSCCVHSLLVGLQSSSHCNFNLAELCRKMGTGVLAVHVEIVALVVLLHQCEDYTGGLPKISVDQLCLQVSRLTLTQHIHLDAPWVRLTLESNTTLEGDHWLIYGEVSGVCATSIAAQRRSMNGWIFPFLVVLSGLPTYRAPKIWKSDP